MKDTTKELREDYDKWFGNYKLVCNDPECETCHKYFLKHIAKKYKWTEAQAYVATDFLFRQKGMN